MSERQDTQYPWLRIFSQPIAFHRIFVDVTGSVHAALMLSQALYWMPRATEPDGSFYKTQEEWQEETGLTRYEQEGARTKLRTKSFWQEKRRGIPARLFFRVDLQALEKQLADMHVEKPHSGNTRKAAPECQSSAVLFGDFPHSITETTTKTTAETTSKTFPPLSPKGGTSVLSQGFLKFWQAYPVKKERAQAWRQWKRKRLEPLTDEICQSITAHHAYDREWQRGYIKYPARYLADECWTDEFSSSPTNGQYALTGFDLEEEGA